MRLLSGKKTKCLSGPLAPTQRHPDDATGGYRAEQRVEIGRDGEVHASWERGPDGLRIRIRIGGEAAIVARGELLL
jgi:predicted PhzF superfamily epimerase YddE/YHI9